MKGYAKKWRLAATVDSCKTNCQTTGTCSCSHFQLGLTKVLARLSARKKHVPVSGEMSKMMLRGLKDNGFMEETCDQRLCIQAVAQSKRTNFPFYLFVSGCVQRQNVTEKQHKASRNNTFYLLWAYSVYLLKGSYRTSAGLFGRKLKNRNTVNAGIRGYTCFLGRPLNSSSNCSASWAPGGSSLFTQKTVEEVSQHSLIGSPCCRRIRAQTCFNCDNNDKTEIYFLLTKLLIDRLFYFHRKSYNDANWAKETSPALPCFHCKLFFDLC